MLTSRPMGVVATQRDSRQGSTVGHRLAAAGWALAVLVAGGIGCLCLAGLALAQNDRAEFPAGKIEFALPDKWSVESGKQKLTLVAPNEDAFIQFTVLQPGTDNALRSQVARALAAYLSDTVVADPGDMITLNNIPAFRVSGTGSSDATSVQFVALALSPTPNQPVLVLAYASQETFPTQAPLFEALFKTLKRR